MAKYVQATYTLLFSSSFRCSLFSKLIKPHILTQSTRLFLVYKGQTRKIAHAWEQGTKNIRK